MSDSPQDDASPKRRVKARALDWPRSTVVSRGRRRLQRVTRAALAILRDAGLATWGHLPIVVLLTLLTVTLHSWHVLDDTEGYFMRWSVQTLLNREPPGPASHALVDSQHKVQVIEASAFMRIKELEQGDEATTDHVSRVGGVRPIDRAKMAGLIDALADRLGAQARGSAHAGPARVVGIDVDLAPLEVTPAPGNSSMLVVDALNKLRRHAVVVVIVLDRPDHQRQARNRFMVDQAACTRYGHESSRSDDLHPLYFASPRVFHAVQRIHPSYPLEFPFAGKPGTTRHALQPAGLHFPSLSNLLHLAGTTDTSAKPVSSPRPRALTLLCEQAAAANTSSAPVGMLLEDLITGLRADACADQGASSPASCAEFDPDAYHMLGINWRLQDTDLLGRTELDSTAQLSSAASAAGGALAGHHLDAGVLILSVDGGGRHDKYVVASATPDPISGASLQALQLLSARPNQALDRHSFVAVLADLVAGTLFLFIWRLVVRLLHGMRRWPKTVLDLIRIATPLGLALGMGLLAIHWASPALLLHDVWMNPAYVLAGMALHAYVEGSDRSTDRHHHAPDFSFGLNRMLDWFGQPAAGELSAQAGSKPAWREPAAIDSGVSWLIQWSLLCYGLFVIARGYHGGPWLVAGLALVIVLVTYLSRRRRNAHEALAPN